MAKKLSAFFVASAVLLLLVSAAYAGQFSVVNFAVGAPSVSFTGGSFSTNLSGIYPDGLYGRSQTVGYNGYGQNGEYILFASPVMLKGLDVQNLVGMDSLTVTVFSASGELLAEKVVANNPAVPVMHLKFNQRGVGGVQFNYSGGYDYYGDGRKVAWFDVANIEYKVMR